MFGVSLKLCRFQVALHIHSEIKAMANLKTSTDNFKLYGRQLDILYIYIYSCFP